MATVKQSLYNIAAALEIIAEELKTLNDIKLDEWNAQKVKLMAEKERHEKIKANDE